MKLFSGLFRSRDKPKNSYDSPSYSYFFGRTHAGDEEGGNLYLVNGSFTKLADAGAFAEKGGTTDESILELGTK